MGRLVFLVLALSVFTWGQVGHAANTIRSREVLPSEVNPSTIMIRGPHLAFNNVERSNGLLVMTLGGTQSYPSDFNVAQKVAVKMGYHVLAVDYPNAITAVECRKAKSLSCYDQFRLEVVEGVDAGPRVAVDYENSILFRIDTLIRFMAATDLQGSWAQFLVNDEIDWNKIILVGHSQGAGHAAYIAKNKPVRAVIMLAGPQDADERGIAPWVQGDHITPSDRYLSFLHEKDYFGVEYQIQVARELQRDGNAPLTRVGGTISPSAQGQIFVSNSPAGDSHNALRGAKFLHIWQTLFRMADHD